MQFSGSSSTLTVMDTVKSMDVGVVKKQRWNGCPTGDGRVDGRFDDSLLDKAKIVMKTKVEQKMQRRSGDKLWAGGLQSEITGPTREQTVSYSYVRNVLSPINHQSNLFSSTRYVKPSNQVVREVHGVRAEVVTE